MNREREREHQYLMAAMQITKNHRHPRPSEFYFYPEYTFLNRCTGLHDIIKIEKDFIKNDSYDFEQKYFEWIKKYFPEKYNLIFGGE